MLPGVHRSARFPAATVLFHVVARERRYSAATHRSAESPAPECGLSVGRPATYCSALCRRATEYEIGRIQMQLERLELQRLDLAGDPLPIPDWIGRGLQQQREANAVRNCH
jgi:hypothetical protein